MLKKCLKGLVFALPLVVAAQSVSAGVKTHPLEGLNPIDYGFSTNNPTNWFRGYEFTVNADNVVASELGMRMPVAGQRVTLELWDNNTQTLIASVQDVTTQTNVWQYFAIPDIALANGGRYTVGILARQTNATYFFKNALPPEWYPEGVIDYQTMRFHGSATSQFPTSVLAGYHYGVADLGYSIPGPGALALIGLGLGVRRRRRA